MKKMGFLKKLLIGLGLVVVISLVAGGRESRELKSRSNSSASTTTKSMVEVEPRGTESVRGGTVASPTDPVPEYDTIGTEKTWGSLSATLKEASASGKTGRVALLLRNDGDEEEKISSLLYFGATNQEGDKGEPDIMGGVNCDGAVPPKGIFKCKLAFKFDTAPKELTIRVGAGVLSKATYFKVRVEK